MDGRIKGLSLASQRERQRKAGIAHGTFCLKQTSLRCSYQLSTL